MTNADLKTNLLATTQAHPGERANSLAVDQTNTELAEISRQLAVLIAILSEATGIKV